MSELPQISDICERYLKVRDVASLECLIEWADILGYFSSWKPENVFPIELVPGVVEALVSDIDNLNDREKACEAGLAFACIYTHQPHALPPLIDNLSPSISDRILQAALGADRLCKFSAMRAMRMIGRLLKCNLPLLLAFLDDPDDIVRGEVASALGGFSAANSWLTDWDIRQIIEPRLAKYAASCQLDEFGNAIESLLQLESLSLETVDVLSKRVCENVDDQASLFERVLKKVLISALSNRACGAQCWREIGGFSTRAIRTRIAMRFC